MKYIPSVIYGAVAMAAIYMGIVGSAVVLSPTVLIIISLVFFVMSGNSMLKAMEKATVQKKIVQYQKLPWYARAWRKVTGKSPAEIALAAA